MHRLEAIRDEEILMRSILPFDEINTFTVRLRQLFPTGKVDKKSGHYEDILDEMLDLFLLSYALGNDVTNESLSSDWEPTLDDVMETVDKKVAGKTWRENRGILRKRRQRGRSNKDHRNGNTQRCKRSCAEDGYLRRGKNQNMGDYAG